MDRFCTMLVIVGAVVLFLIGYGELRHMYPSKSQGTCGAPAAASAKQAIQKAPKAEPSYEALDGEWLAPPPLEKPSSHTNEDLLAEQFGTWDADTSESEKFNAGKVIKVGIKNKTGILPQRNLTETETPLGTKNIGMPNPMLAIYKNNCGESKNVQFTGESSMCFNATDNYVTARQKAIGR